MSSVQTSELFNDGNKRMFKFFRNLETSPTNEQKEYFINSVADCLTRSYPGISYNRYIQNESHNLEAIAVHGLNDFMYIGPNKQGHDITRNMPAMFNNELQDYNITEVTLKDGDDKILLFYCILPERVSDSQKNEFHHIIQDYVEKQYSEEEASFYEDVNTDTLSSIVLLHR